MKKRPAEDEALELEHSGDGEDLRTSKRVSTLAPNNTSRATRSTGINAGSYATRSTRSKPTPSWADHQCLDFDGLRWLNSEYSIVDDPLTQPPRKHHTYIDLNGKLKDPDKYDVHKKSEDPHPKLARYIQRGTDTPAIRLYYKDMPHDRDMPIAGKSIDQPDLPDHLSITPKVCSGQDSQDSAVRDPVESSSSSSSASEDSSEQALFPGLARKPVSKTNNEGVEKPRSNTNNEFQEEAFHAKQMIKIPIPDHIKAILVDDWENVTKNQQLVPLPAAQNVDKILKDYLEYEQEKRDPGSAQAAILTEVCCGLKEYFDKCLGRILLYRYDLSSHL
jgi:mortality factor 4-like protein 1